MNFQRKTGVLTFHRCINYGSYWQARCLVEGLRALGQDAVILDHDSRRVNYSEWKCAFRPVLPTSVPKSDYPLYREKIRKFFCAFASMPLSPRFNLDNPDEMESYDLVIVGSDEVWNLSHPWYGGCRLFYGKGIRGLRLISYAASFGNYASSWGLHEFWAGLLRNFDSISVRDENSRRIIKAALGFEPQLTLDPCLQFPLQPEGSWHGPDFPFIAVYGHNFTTSFIREARRWSTLRGLPLVSIGYRNDWANMQWLTAGPHDFAHGMARAEAVATNFFHGCVFALRNAKPFICETSSYRSFKIQDLMTTVGGEHHLVSEETPSATFDALLCEPPAQGIQDRITCLRQMSEAYLHRAVG